MPTSSSKNVNEKLQVVEKSIKDKIKEKDFKKEVDFIKFLD